MTFDSFGLHPKVAAGLGAAGYTNPTPIQARAIPAVLAGRDLLGLAQTGTGKTAAFVLPLLDRLQGGPRNRIRALVVAPTRELAEQINDEVRLLGHATGLRSTTVYGGVGMQPQVAALRGRAEIVVACPGRLLDHLERGNADLSQVEAVVLDEADHMFDMGFLPSVRRILRHVPATAQKLLFSATMPADLRHLVEETLRDPVTVEVNHSAPADTVAHALYPTAQKRKTELLVHLLTEHQPRSALVFTRTKHGAKRLAEQLDRRGFEATSLQGNLSQNRRQQALDGFREGRYKIMVATDIAARGIDISRVSHVINFDVPNTAEAYTHRIGRTGRAERTGEAFTLVTSDDDKQVRMIERALGGPIERVLVDGFGFDEGDAASAATEPAGRGQRGARAPRDGGQARGGRTGRQQGSARTGQQSNGGRAGQATRAPEHQRRAQPGPRADRAETADPAAPARPGPNRRRRARGSRGGRDRNRSDQRPE